MLIPPRWPLQDGLELAALPGAVPSARLHAKAIAYEWRLPACLVEVAELLVSELVTNAARACSGCPGRPPVVLRLFSDSRYLLIEVWDASLCPPVPVEADELAELPEGGRGLHLVDALATKWGWYFPKTDGKVVWAEIHPE